MSEYWSQAKSQGCLRPFQILCDMDSETRNNIREILGFSFGTNQGNPEAESWDIINCDLKGLQASSHAWYEKANPWCSNSTWKDILYRCITEGFKVSQNISSTNETFPINSELEMESQFLQILEEKIVKNLDEDKKSQFTLLSPNIKNCAKRIILLLAIASKEMESSAIHALAHFLAERLGAKIITTMASQSLKFVLRGIDMILWAWLAHDAMNFILGPSYSKLIQAVTLIILNGYAQNER